MSEQVYRTFDQDYLREIAKGTGVRQTIADVNYASFLHYHNPQKVYCEYLDGAFILGAKNKSDFRIIGMATSREHQGQGKASLLLKRAVEYAKKKGYSRITTLTYSGIEFYLRRGFDIYGYKGNELYLELKL